MAEHDRRGAAEADAVRRLHHREPLRRVDLVGADDRAHLVVEHLGRGSGQGSEPRVAQRAEERLHIPAQRLRALPDLERGEGVQVHAGQRRFQAAADVEIGLAGIVGMDAALQAHFGCAPRLRLGRAPRHFVQIEPVSRTSQSLRRTL